MWLSGRSVLAWAALAAALAILPPTPAQAALSTVRVARGLARPVFATAPRGDTARLFVIEQHSGRIRIVRLADGSIDATDFLTLGGLATGNEQGLLGLAFHPDYASNGYFYVNLTVAGGDTEIRRYRVSANPDVADPGSAQRVLGWQQPQPNHNGGWLGFGPDGYLYVSSGDGGGANDSASGHTPGTGNAQDLTDNLLGKLLRLDVDGDAFPADPARNYAIPAGNPFVGVSGDDEIWAYGLRNPWRASFDRATGHLYIGDVGQFSREEIDVQLAGSRGGENFGWRAREGTIATPSGGVGGPRPAGAIDPIYDYPRGSGISVTGGYVYRGPVAEARGRYFFADYGSARIWSLVYDGSDPAAFDGTNHTQLTDRTAELVPDAGTIEEISSFAEDDAGNLYILDLGGEIFRLTAGRGATTTVTTTTSTTLPGAAILLPGRALVVRQRRSGAQRLRLVARDRRTAAAAPCDQEGELVVEALGTVRRFPLDAALWSPLGPRRPGRGCAYRRGPVVSSVRVKPASGFVVRARGDLGIPLAADPQPVRIELRHGDVRHCLEFGGRRRRHVPDDRLVAKRAAVATTCPASEPFIRSDARSPG